MNPSRSGWYAVTFNTTDDALAGTPCAPATVITVDELAPGLVPLRVSRMRTGSMPRKADAPAGTAEATSTLTPVTMDDSTMARRTANVDRCNFLERRTRPRTKGHRRRHTVSGAWR